MDSLGGARDATPPASNHLVIRFSTSTEPWRRSARAQTWLGRQLCFPGTDIKELVFEALQRPMASERGLCCTVRFSLPFLFSFSIWHPSASGVAYIVKLLLTHMALRLCPLSTPLPGMVEEEASREEGVFLSRVPGQCFGAASCPSAEQRPILRGSRLPRLAHCVGPTRAWCLCFLGLSTSLYKISIYSTSQTKEHKRRDECADWASGDH